MSNKDEHSDREMRVFPTMIASSLAGGLARLPCHPIDTVKSRIQTQNWMHASSGTVYRNFLHGLRKTWAREGLRGLYRGLGPTMLGSVPASCLYFTTYEIVKSRLESQTHSNAAVHLTGGLIAEAVSCVLYVPIDVVKERMQIQHVPSVAVKSSSQDVYYTSGSHAIRSIVQTEGIIGLYRGYGATVMSFGPYSGLMFAFYEVLKGRLEPSFSTGAGRVKGRTSVTTELPFGALLFCSATAGAGASFLTNPLDMVKLRLQVQRQKLAVQKEAVPADAYKNMLDGLTKLAKAEGLRGMLRGAGARVAFHSLSTAVGMTLFESLKEPAYIITNC